MHLFKQKVTWIILSVLAILGAIVGCAISNPEGTRIGIKIIIELAYWCLLWVFAIKFIYFLLDVIIGPPSK
jgi:hypothetical protein